jgi:manganese transport protein
LKTLNIGPGVLVTAAFIGPGTLTICTMAGVQTGTQLLWAVVLATLITIFIQNVAARIAWHSEQGLATVLLSSTGYPMVRTVLMVLLLLAIIGGNAAYEGGNLSGAFLGLNTLLPTPEMVVGETSFSLGKILMGLAVGSLLWLGNTEMIKKILIVVVLLMSASFLLSAFLVQPDLGSLLNGLLIPQVPQGEWTLLVALLGTTVVPYNLFLHAALVKSKRKTGISLEAMQKDTRYAVGIGGLISACIILAASAVQGSEIVSVADLGQSLVPLYGPASSYFIAFGLFAAGFSSALTAPLAAGYVAQECWGWEAHSYKTKITALLVLGVGLWMTFFNVRPLEIIRMAQWANGLLLPLVGLFLFIILSKQKKQLNVRPYQRGLMGLIVLFFIVMTLRSLGFLT